MQPIGMIGGLGPYATVAFYAQLIDRLSDLDDSGLPELVIQSVPAKHQHLATYVNANAWHMPEAEKHLRGLLTKAVKRLMAQGIKNIVMPCNTLQPLLQSICDDLHVKNLNVIHATATATAQRQLNKVLVLGTSSTYRLGEYLKALHRSNIKAVYLSGSQQTELERYIQHVVTHPKQAAEQSLLPLVQTALQVSPHIEGVVLGCTDLTGLLTESELGLPVIDSVAVAVEETVKTYLNTSEKKTFSPFSTPNVLISKCSELSTQQVVAMN